MCGLFSPACSSYRWNKTVAEKLKGEKNAGLAPLFRAGESYKEQAPLILIAPIL